MLRLQTSPQATRREDAGGQFAGVNYKLVHRSTRTDMIVTNGANISSHHAQLDAHRRRREIIPRHIHHKRSDRWDAMAISFDTRRQSVWQMTGGSGSHHNVPFRALNSAP